MTTIKRIVTMKITMNYYINAIVLVVVLPEQHAIRVEKIIMVIMLININNDYCNADNDEKKEVIYCQSCNNDDIADIQQYSMYNLR